MGMVLLASSACSTAETLPAIPSSIAPQKQSGEQSASVRGEMARPPFTQIDYRSNGTLSYVKGGNLAVDLKEMPHFQSALNNKDYEQMAYLFFDYYKAFFTISSMPLTAGS
jgi:hypothetical protein